MRGRLLALVFAVIGMLAMPPAAGAAEPPASAGRFIVTLHDSSDARSVAAEYRRDGADIDFVYTAALNGFAGAFSDSTLGRLRADGRVARIERDGIATASETTWTQSPATWGLDRIDQAAPTPSGSTPTYTYNHTGAGVTAYIIDTGILLSHSEFGSRASFGYDAFGGTGTDCNGHGTHVAGTVGGTTYGVAKGVSLVAVRVLDCNGSGSWSGVIAGLDWITANHASAPAVANMSLGGGASSSVDDAVNRTIADGVAMAVAAGNGNKAGIAQDACGYSPARVPAALTVGSTTSSDVKSSWSNYGSCVDLFAPGSSITSAWYTSTTATYTISGTSMATPHVAGVAALYLQQAPAAAPATVSSAIVDGSTKGIVSSSNTENNHLLYSLLTAGTAPEPLPTGTVTGTVTSGSGVVKGASVTASGVSTTTGDNGVYTLTLPAGEHTVQVTAAGFASQSKNVMVTAGQQANLDFALVAAPAPAVYNLTLTKGPKVKNVTEVTATWEDTEGTNRSYDVWANGSIRATVTGGSHAMKWRGSGTLTYRVCRAGSATTCSEDARITV